MIESAESYAPTKSWDCLGATTLDMHLECCKSAYIEMEAAVDHVSHEIAGQYTCVKRLIISIDGCNEPGMQAVISTINNPANNLCDDLSGAYLLLLPACSIARWINKKQNNAQISDVGSNLCQGTSDTGAEYCHNKPDE